MYLICLRLEKRKTIAIRREEERKETPPFSFESETDRETDTGVEKKRTKRAKEVSQRETERCLRAYLMIVFFF
jgi:hypothetical protein